MGEGLWPELWPEDLNFEPQLGVGCQGGPQRAARAVDQRRLFQGLMDAPLRGTPGERTRYEFQIKKINCSICL